MVLVTKIGGVTQSGYSELCPQLYKPSGCCWMWSRAEKLLRAVLQKYVLVWTEWVTHPRGPEKLI